MILSVYEEFSDSQAETTVATHVSDSVVDLLTAGDSVGREIRFHAVVAVTCTSGGSATVQIILETDGDVAFGSSVTLWSSAAIAVASLAQGYKFTGKDGLRLPSNVERYLRASIIIGTAVLTAGAFDIFLSNDSQSNDFTTGVGA